MMSTFVKRSCPNCNSNSHESAQLALMRCDKLLASNPGYDIAWFTHSSIPLNYEFTFVQCSKCDFVFSLEKLEESLNFEYYNYGIDHQKSLDKIFKKSKRQHLIQLWSTLHELENTSSETSSIKVLDFGAGWGDFLALAKGYGIDVYGLEYDKRKIAFAKINEIACGDYDFVASHAPYDVFMCNQVLEHLDKPKKALEQLRGLLLSGSVGFIAVPCYTREKVEEEISRLKVGELPSKNFDPLGHLNYFDPVSFHNMVLSHGFAKIDMNPNVKSPQPQNIKTRIKSIIKKMILRSFAQSSHASLIDDRPSTTSLFVRAI